MSHPVPVKKEEPVVADTATTTTAPATTDPKQDPFYWPFIPMSQEETARLMKWRVVKPRKDTDPEVLRRRRERKAKQAEERRRKREGSGSASDDDLFVGRIRGPVAAGPRPPTPTPPPSEDEQNQPPSA